MLLENLSYNPQSTFWQSDYIQTFRVSGIEVLAKEVRIPWKKRESAFIKHGYIRVHADAGFYRQFVNPDNTGLVAKLERFGIPVKTGYVKAGKKKGQPYLYAQVPFDHVLVDMHRPFGDQILLVDKGQGGIFTVEVQSIEADPFTISANFPAYQNKQGRYVQSLRLLHPKTGYSVHNAVAKGLGELFLALCTGVIPERVDLPVILYDGKPFVPSCNTCKGLVRFEVGTDICDTSLADKKATGIQVEPNGFCGHCGLCGELRMVEAYDIFNGFQDKDPDLGYVYREEELGGSYFWTNKYRLGGGNKFFSSKELLFGLQREIGKADACPKYAHYKSNAAPVTAYFLNGRSWTTEMEIGTPFGMLAGSSSFILPDADLIPKHLCRVPVKNVVREKQGYAVNDDVREEYLELAAMLVATYEKEGLVGADVMCCPDFQVDFLMIESKYRAEILDEVAEYLGADEELTSLVLDQIDEYGRNLYRC